MPPSEIIVFPDSRKSAFRKNNFVELILIAWAPQWKRKYIVVMKLEWIYFTVF